MPAKGRRIASRQAQLGRRRRQQNRKTEESLAVSVAAPADIPAETAAPANAAAAANPAAANPAPAGPAATPARAPRRPAAGQTRTDRSAAYTHLGSEMRRILILAGILLAVLVGLSFVI